MSNRMRINGPETTSYDELLTDEASSVVDKLGPLVRFGILVFITYVLARHVGWLDACGAVAAFWCLLFRLGSR